MKILVYVPLAVLMLLSACQNSNSTKNAENTGDSIVVVDEHTSENSLDWNGLYEGVTPCADCPGIKQLLTLNLDNTFQLHTEYLERDTFSKDSGNFVWENNGSQIYINTANNQMKLKVREGSLLLLDQEGNEISSDLADAYVLTKK